MFNKITKIVVAMLIVAFATSVIPPVTTQASSGINWEDLAEKYPDIVHKSEDDSDDDEAPIYGPISLEPLSFECDDFNTLDELVVLCSIDSSDDYVLQHTDMKLYRNGKLVYKGKMYGDELDVSRETKYSKGATGVIDTHKHKKVNQGIYTVKYRYNHKGIKTDWETQTVVTSAWVTKYYSYNIKHSDDGNFKWAKHPNAYKYDVYVIKASDYAKGIKPVKVASTKKNKINRFDVIDNYNPYGSYMYFISPVCKYKGKIITG